MKKVLQIAIMISLFVAAGMSHAVIPNLIPVQGVLADSDQNPIEGPIDLTFGLFADKTGGASIWTETRADVAVSNGAFTVYLGEETTLDPAVLAGPDELWLEISVEGETLTRVQLAAVPFAFEAIKVGGLEETDIQPILSGTNACIGTQFLQGWDAVLGRPICAEAPQGPQGIQGEPGTKGDPGEDGDPGDPGGDGVDCWDLDANGICDDLNGAQGDEDVNGDDVCDASDCTGAQGPKGDQGDPGIDGANPPIGAIMAFAGDSGTLPSNWVPCDGRTIADPDPGLFDFNAGVSGLQVPALQDNRFLMGVSSGSIGSMGGRNDIPTDGNHTHTFTQTEADYAPDASNFANGSYPNNAGDHTHGGENRPRFMGVLHIIRIN